MAGWGSRLRPHTLTTPKPMLPIAGKPIVQRLVEDLMKATNEKIENVVFIIRKDFGEEIEKHLMEIAKTEGVNGHIRYQDEPLGTAHAILCAGEFLQNKIIVAFADTLFRLDFKIDAEKDGVIFVQHVSDPSAFGVVKLGEAGVITDFVEKPKEFVSDLAIIGIYYFRDGALLQKEMQYLIDNNIRHGNEFQLTDAMENLKRKGTKFYKGEVIDWLDCGNKAATVATNQTYLGYIKDEQLIAASANIENSVIIPPCFIDENVVIKNAVIGPYVSIGKNTAIENCVIKNSIIQTKTVLKNKLIQHSMIGNNVNLVGKFEDLSIGDYVSQA